MSKVQVTPLIGGGSTEFPVVGTYTGKGSNNGLISLTVPNEVKTVFIVGNGCFLAFARGAKYATAIGVGVAYSSDKIQMTRAKLTWSGTTVTITKDQIVDISSSATMSNNTSDKIAAWDSYSSQYTYIMF